MLNHDLTLRSFSDVNLNQMQIAVGLKTGITSRQSLEKKSVVKPVELFSPKWH